MDGEKRNDDVVQAKRSGQKWTGGGKVDSQTKVTRDGGFEGSSHSVARSGEWILTNHG